MAIKYPYNTSATTETYIVTRVVNTSTLVYLKVIRIPGIYWNLLINLGFSEDKRVETG